MQSSLQYRKWNRTLDNEPGHDGCLCIYFDGHMTEWWMEAKYSLFPNNLSRGRLDPTIIEVLLNDQKTVERLFIVTNCDISAKIKNDIKKIIINNSQCHNIDFVTKDLLELWLIEHYDVYTNYFEHPIPQTDLVLSSDLFITKDLEVYDIMGAQSLHQEPQGVLYLNKRYNLYFSVYSKNSTIVKITSDFFVFDAGANTINLVSGINECKISGLLSSCNKMQNAILEVKLSDTLTKKIISCKNTYTIDISSNNDNFLRTLSQESCLYSLKNNINAEDKAFQLFSIYGDSGMGKTFISNYIPDVISDNIIEFESFVDDPYVNAKYILRTLLYIYFPYAYGDTLSESAKSLIRNNFHTGIFLYKLTTIDFQNKPESLLSLFRETCNMYLFPKLGNSCKRYIIWDNISKLDDSLLRFVVLFIKQLKIYNENISFVIIQNNIINDLFPIINHNYQIRLLSKDIENLLGVQLCEDEVNKYFPNLLTVFDLKKFLSDYNLAINGLDEFKLHYLKFLHGGYGFSFIERKILKLSNEESLILNRIYYAYSGLSLENFSDKISKDKIRDIIFKLIDIQLIKYNAEHKLVPYHDIYQKSYKKHYRFNKKALEIAKINNNEELLKNQLLSLTEDNIQPYCDAIKAKLNLHQFSSVYFILEELLEYSDEIKRQIGNNAYLQLKYYRIYADANVKMSGQSAYQQFFDLWNDLQQVKISASNYKLILHTLYELSNAAYDNFDYQQCFTYQKHSHKIELQLNKLGYERDLDNDIEYCYNQIDYMALLSKSELGEKVTYKNYDNCEGKYRFLRSRCISLSGISQFVNFAKRTLTEDCLNNNIKHYIKADFDVSFLEIITNKNIKLWYKNLLDKRKKFDGINKNYYVKATYSIISILLVLQLFDEAERLNNASFYGTNSNPRMYSFYLEINAAIKAHQQDYSSAITMLKKQYKLCKKVKSYADIVSHNLSVLKNCAFNDKFAFYFDNMNLALDTFLLDPRCFY